MSSLQRFLDDGRLRRQRSSKSEIASLFMVVDRDIQDSGVCSLSEDRRFAIAYNAALQLATIVLRAEGLRTVGSGHHRITIAAFPLILGSRVQETADYLDACRSRRNTVDYDGIGIATERDVAELLAETAELRQTVEAWLKEEHPELRDEVGS
ncbi:MAG: hypothetical protein U1E22_10285 [Coriobacteriia bacterium]|nr:hypothetical protein [Coriobacteriia bacterium]